MIHYPGRQCNRRAVAIVGLIALIMASDSYYIFGARLLVTNRAYNTTDKVSFGHETIRYCSVLETITDIFLSVKTKIGYPKICVTVFSKQAFEIFSSRKEQK